jgi:hypothetical protein
MSQNPPNCMAMPLKKVGVYYLVDFLTIATMAAVQTTTTKCQFWSWCIVRNNLKLTTTDTLTCPENLICYDLIHPAIFGRVQLYFISGPRIFWFLDTTAPIKSTSHKNNKWLCLHRIILILLFNGGRSTRGSRWTKCICRRH